MSNTIFDIIIQNQGRQFTLENGETFSYTVKNGEIFIEQKNWSVTRSDIEAAIKYKGSAVSKLSDSKKLSYIFSILEQAQESIWFPPNKIYLTAAPYIICYFI